MQNLNIEAAALIPADTKTKLEAAEAKLAEALDLAYNLEHAVATCAGATYTGSAATPAVTVTLAGKTLAEGTDYTVTYADNVNAGTARATVEGMGSYLNSTSATFAISPAAIESASVVLETTAYAYNGKPAKPAASTVTVNGAPVPKGQYAVEYSNNVNVGTATATVSFANYAGSKDAAFTINPKGTALKKPKGAKGSIKVRWKKQAAQTTGYQIRYSAKKSMKKAKTLTVKKAGAKKKTIKKLKAKKRYYVQIRTYKKVGSQYYYSAWSKKKSVKTK